MLQIVGQSWSRDFSGTGFTVWVKPTWADAWTLLPFVKPLEYEDACAPELPTATFVWHYGSVQWQEVGGHVLCTPYDLQNWYIAVWAHRDEGSWAAWIGIVESQAFEWHGVTTEIPVSGDEHFHAYGLEYLLDRRRIAGTYTDTNGVTPLMTTWPVNKRYDRGITPAGNRSTNVGALGTYVFGGTEEWNALQFVQYVLAHFQPTNVPFVLMGSALTVLEQIKPAYEYEGRTVRDVLNEFCNHKRGLSWKLITSGAGNVIVFVFSELAEDLYAGGITIPRNPNQNTVDFADYVEVKPRVMLSGLHRYDTIVVASEEKLKVCFTASFANGRLEKGWTDAEEAAYKAATDKERATDKHSRVYTTFRLKRDLDWTGILPSVNTDGTVTTAETGAIHLAGKRFERHVPFLEEAEIEGAEPTYREMIALIADSDGDYHYVENVSSLRGADCTARPEDHELAIRVKNQRANHLLALNHWDGAAATKHRPQLDYETLVVTVFLETDLRLAVYLPIWDAQASEAGKTLHLTVPGAEYWLVAENTVEDVDDGVLRYYAGDSVLRDDGARVRSVAATAAAWYGQAAAGLEYELDQILPIHPVGTLVYGTVSGWHLQPVGSVVTKRKTYCQEGRMGVYTGYRNLDERAEDLGELGA